MRTLVSMSRPRPAWLGLIGISALVGSSACVLAAEPSAVKAGKADNLATGREIFNREWLPGDARGQKGDGLGPVYNDTSCVACHNSGGAGGAGPISKNIDILSAARTNVGNQLAPIPVAPAPGGTTETGDKPAPRTSDPLFDVHAGFRASRTVVLHKFGIDPNYQAWRRSALDSKTPLVGVPPAFMSSTIAPGVVLDALAISNPGTAVTKATIMVESLQGSPAPQPAVDRFQQARAELVSPVGPRIQVVAGEFVVSRSQRNPTSLFGIGLIDKISEKAIMDL
ncbi:hypothetical protein ACYOEI_16090, partial [Singulisphaera rosea]